jgi:hypothetical protein
MQYGCPIQMHIMPTLTRQKNSAARYWSPESSSQTWPELRVGVLITYRRQMMLSHIITSGLRHPNATFFRYDKIRSGAVHGEKVPEVSRSDAQDFEWAVRDVLAEYLTLVQQRRLSRRGRLLKTLDEHPDRTLLIAWPRDHGGPVWTKYLDKITAMAARPSKDQKLAKHS